MVEYVLDLYAVSPDVLHGGCTHFAGYQRHVLDPTPTFTNTVCYELMPPYP